jgi:hypothetical protein
MIPFYPFPYRIAKSHEVFNTEDYMDMFGPLVGAIGNLGFHSFNDSNSFSRTHVHHEAAFRTSGASTVNTFTSSANHGMDVTTAPTAANNSTEIQLNMDWQVLQTLDRFFYTSTTIINGKAQVMRDVTSAGSADVADNIIGFQLAIRIDGLVYEDGSSGGRQSTNDPSPIYWPSGYKGINALAIIPLLEGNHKIELVARCGREDDWDSVTSPVLYYVGNSYLTFLECLV